MVWSSLVSAVILGLSGDVHAAWTNLTTTPTGSPTERRVTGTTLMGNTTYDGWVDYGNDDYNLTTENTNLTTLNLKCGGCIAASHNLAMAFFNYTSMMGIGTTANDETPPITQNLTMIVESVCRNLTNPIWDRYGVVRVRQKGRAFYNKSLVLVGPGLKQKEAWEEECECQFDRNVETGTWPNLKTSLWTYCNQIFDNFTIPTLWRQWHRSYSGGTEGPVYSHWSETFCRDWKRCEYNDTINYLSNDFHISQSGWMPWFKPCVVGEPVCYQNTSDFPRGEDIHAYWGP